MYDKLSLINTALTRTANNVINFEGDDSPEWIVMSDAYETELPVLIEAHDWGFATTFASLTRSGDSADPRFADAYEKPIGCLHVISVLLDARPIAYDIVDNLIVCTAEGTLPSAKYVRTPSADQWPHGFLEVLRLKLMAHAYRSLNEDQDAALRYDAVAERKLSEVKTRVAQEKPARAMVYPRLRMARSIRRGGVGRI